MGSILVEDEVLTQEGLQEAAADAEEQLAEAGLGPEDAPFAYDVAPHPPPSEKEDVLWPSQYSRPGRGRWSTTT
eukprot:14395280-Alexandrium_andersonii.AAC.1